MAESVPQRSYVPLPSEQRAQYSIGAPSDSRRPFKELLLIFSTFSIILGLAAIVGYKGSISDAPILYNSDSNPSLSSTAAPDTFPATTWQPISRGVSAGVSEKSNLLFDGNNGAVFPWNNSMLSYQRTAFHFQPEKNWMNDPNGPMYYKGWYHIFYQYYPDGAFWGKRIVWGHAVSRDLIHWLHLPPAMRADQWYDTNGVWSGSATFLPDGQIVMLYTGSTNESVQVQNLAYPADPSDPLLINWVKYPGNPILFPPPKIGIKDFRDPTTAWLTSQGKWRISIGSKRGRTGIAFVYETVDFKNYVLLEKLLNAVQGTGMWESVDFYPVSKKSDIGLDTSINGPDVRHVIKVSIDETRFDHYVIGTYDEKEARITSDNPDLGVGLRVDYGKFYAAKTFYDQHKKRRVLWSWIGESDSEVADVRKGWASVQGIPRTVVLDRKTGSDLLFWPVREVENLRLRSDQFDNLKLKPGSVMALDVGTATQLDIITEFEIEKNALEKMLGTNSEYSCTGNGGAAQRGALGPFGLLVLAEDSLTEYTPVYFYVSKKADGNLQTFFCLDQQRSSEANDVVKKVFGSVVPILKDEKLSLRILVDHSIIESFAQGGRRCITSRVYPTKAIYGAARLFLFNNATETSVSASLTVWQMNSAFIRPYHPDQSN